MSHFLRAFILLILIGGCQRKEKKSDFSFEKKEPINNPKVSTSIDLKSKGVGPVEKVMIDEPIDQIMVEKGKELYIAKCTACHKIGSTFIGPPPNGILKRRTPEWIMNMILNPDGMIEEDSLAKALFMEFNGQLMTNQGLDEEEARNILEYFRTLE